LSFCYHCIVCPSNYCFWLSLRYFQTFHTKYCGFQRVLIVMIHLQYFWKLFFEQVSRFVYISLSLTIHICRPCFGFFSYHSFFSIKVFEVLKCVRTRCLVGPHLWNRKCLPFRSSLFYLGSYYSICCFQCSVLLTIVCLFVFLDKSWMRKGQDCDYDKRNISRTICDTDTA
jgi:hypothetical protein